MNYILNFILFTIASLLACAINDIINIKIERRIGITKKPWTLLVRHTPGYFKLTPLTIILFIASIFSSQNMSENIEYTLLPIILIFATKLLSTERNKNDIYFETIGLAAIFISMLPILLNYQTTSWLTLISAIISIKIFNKNTQEPLPLNSARLLALNCYVLSAYFPHINFIISILLSVVLIYIQNIVYVLIPKFNDIKNMRLAFRWAFLCSMTAFIINSVIIVLITRR
jgi:hypothetical protein